MFSPVSPERLRWDSVSVCNLLLLYETGRSRENKIHCFPCDKSLRLFTIYMKTSVRQQLHKWQVKMLHSVIFVRIWSFIIWYIYLEPRTSSRWSQLQMESTICTRIVRWEILDKHVPFISDIFRSAELKLSHHDLHADRNFKSLYHELLTQTLHLLLCMSMLGFSNLLLHYLNGPL